MTDSLRFPNGGGAPPARVIAYRQYSRECPVKKAP